MKQTDTANFKKIKLFLQKTLDYNGMPWYNIIKIRKGGEKDGQRRLAQVA
nr:MAG TPA: hypothetical protein [Caudoviricetes sp.]